MITIRALPSNTAPQAVDGAFSILGYSAHADLSVGHTELLTSALYVEERTAVAAYRDAVQQLRAAALSVDESR